MRHISSAFYVCEYGLYLFCLTIFCFFSCNKHDSTHHPDREKIREETSQIEKVEGDTSRINLFVKMAKEFRNKEQYDSTIKYFKKAHEIHRPLLSQTKDSSRWHDYLFQRISVSYAYMQLHKLDIAISIAREVLRESDSVFTSDTKIQADAHGQLSSIYEKKPDLDSALFHADQAIAMYREIIGPSISLAQAYKRRGIVIQDKGAYQESLEEYQHAAAILLDSSESSYFEKASVLNSLGIGYFNMGNLQEAIKTFEKAIGYLEKDETGSIELSGMFYNNLSISHARLGDYDQSLSLLDQAEFYYRKIYEEQHPIFVYGNLNRGLNYKLLGEFDQARFFLQKGYDLSRKTNGFHHIQSAKCLLGLGGVEKALGRYHLAEQYLRMERNIEIDRGYDTRGNQVNFAALLLDQGKYEEAQSLLHAAYLELQDSEEENLPILSSIYGKMIETYVLQGNLDSAQQYLAKATEIDRQLHRELNINKVLFLTTKAEMSGTQIAYEEAIQFVRQSIDIARKRHKDQSKNIPELLLDLGKMLTRAKKPMEGLKSLHEAFLYIAPDFSPTSLYDSPDIETDLILNPWLLNELLAAKGACLITLYQQSKKVSDARAAIKTYSELHQSVNSLKETYQADLSKEFLLEQVAEAYAKAVEVSLAAYQQTNNDSFLYSCFRFMEYEKANLLKESIQSTKAKAALGLPDSLLQKEKSYRTKIAGYKKLIYDEQTYPGETDRSKIHLWEDYLFTYSQKLDTLLQRIDLQYPTYKHVKTSYPELHLDSITNHLKDHTSMIEYVWAKDQLMALAISKEGIVPYQTQIDSALIHAVTQMTTYLQTPPLPYQPDSEKMQQSDQFARDAAYVYQRILHPLLTQLDSTHTLTIIPDGPLNYVPFELLETGNPTQDSSHTPSLLLEQYHIHYDYSAMMTSSSTEREKSYKAFTGFAPAFNDMTVGQKQERLSLEDSIRFEISHSRVRDNYTALTANIPEVKAIQSIVNGDIYTGSEAQKEIFLERSTSYAIIHLATHAIVDENESDYSMLVFAPEPDHQDYQFLYAYELYNLDLHAELAVLSACRTHVGIDQKGEGVKSLARAFKYAGCPNILTSLWQADDQVTKTIMVDFYRNLGAGLGKAEALQKAKMDFRKNASGEFKHPFYWAPFILIGDNEPMEIPAPLAWSQIVFICLLILGFLSLIGFRYRSRVSEKS